MRNPEPDSLPPTEPIWEDIPLGPGQEPSPRAHFQHTREGDPIRGTDVRRKPGYEEFWVTHRYPERPA